LSGAGQPTLRYADLTAANSPYPNATPFDPKRAVAEPVQHLVVVPATTNAAPGDDLVRALLDHFAELVVVCLVHFVQPQPRQQKAQRDLLREDPIVRDWALRTLVGWDCLHDEAADSEPIDQPITRMGEKVPQ
jgi:hypothetical protein